MSVNSVFNLPIAYSKIVGVKLMQSLNEAKSQFSP